MGSWLSGMKKLGSNRVDSDSNTSSVIFYIQIGLNNVFEA